MNEQDNTQHVKKVGKAELLGFNGGDPAGLWATPQRVVEDSILAIHAEQTALAQAIAFVQAHGYIVERAPDGRQLSQHAISKFRAAWHAADREGRLGSRVRAGLEAARPAMNLEAVAKIDDLIGEIGDEQTASGPLGEILTDLRVMIAPGVPVLSKVSPAKSASTCRCKAYSEYRGGGYSELMLEPEPDCPEHGEPVDDARFRCTVAGCNPKLYGEDAAADHRATTGHRTAKWPVRSEEGKRREHERNRNGYHSRHRKGGNRG